MNLVELTLPKRILGLEGAGVIHRIGSGVKDLNVGERVVTFERNTFATFVITTEPYCVKIPDSLSFEEASGMFMPYVTAWHSFVNVGCLEKGQVSCPH